MPMPNYRDKTKDELIKELQKLQHDYDSLKTSYSKDVAECKQAEKTLTQQKDALLKLNSFSIELSKLSLEDNLEAFIARHLKKITGAKAVIFSEYSHINRTTTTKHIEIDSRLLKKVVSLLGQDIYKIHSEVSDELYHIMTSEIIGVRKTLFEASFGAIPRPVGAAIKALLKADRFIGLAYLIEGKLYGTSLLAMSQGQSDPPRKILETFMSLAAVSLQRKLAEEALRESEERYRLLFDSSPDGLVLIGIDGLIKSVNLEQCRMFRYNSPEEMIGISPGLLVAPLMREFGADIMRRRLKGNKSPNIVYRLIRKDGTEFWGETSATVLLKKDGSITGYICLTRDITERKQTEKIIRESEELFRIVISNAPISIFATDDKGIFILHEGKALEKTGMKPGENVGVSAYDLFSDLKVVERNGNVITGKSILDRVLNGKKLSGITELNGVHFDNQFVPIVDINGQVTGLIGVATDVTEPIKTAKALGESEVRFQSIFENSLLGISLADPEGKLVLANSAYARMYGYENPEKMLAEVTYVKNLYAHPEVREEVIRKLQRDRQMHPREVEVIRRDGTRFFVLVSAMEIRDSEGHLIYYQAVHLDLTERKKIEEEIHDSAQYTRSLIEANLDPLVTINPEGKITDLNSATEKITGIKRAKLIGSDIADYFSEPDKVRKGFKLILSRGSVKNYPMTVLHSSGKTTDVLFNATLYKNIAGEVLGVFADARDITDRKKIEEELRKSKELLEKLNQHLHDVRENERAFISREIHDELGQSMTALKLDLNRMHKYVGSNPEAIMKLDNMIELVSDTIKDVQRISSDLRPGILDDLGLVSAIEWYCEEFEKRTGIRCKLKLDNSDFNDSKMNLTFFRALQETLTNVIRHAKASSVNVKLHQTNKGVTLVVQDNGIGIPEEKIESHKSLGLISMRERVRQFGGKVDISSEKGKGSQFIIFIPEKKGGVQ
jgi:PAS domain S-box-containing protein